MRAVALHGHGQGRRGRFGWPPGSVQLEYFKAGSTPLPEDNPDETFEVELARSSLVYVVPSGTSIVSALAEQGIEIPVSCEQGICGTCLVRVLSGQPDHRDMYLTVEEQEAGDQMTACVSRSKGGRLVLDL